MATKTKTKIKDSLKNVFINELKDKKETDRLERVKANADLKKVTIYTHKDQQHCKQFTDILTQEGIKFTEVDASEGVGLYDWNKIISITNLAFFPTVLVNKNFLVQRRDFQNPQQLVGAIQHFANPDFVNPDFERHMIEKTKTDSYNLHARYYLKGYFAYVATEGLSTDAMSVGVGRMFDFSDVRKNIEDQIIK